MRGAYWPHLQCSGLSLVHCFLMGLSGLLLWSSGVLREETGSLPFSWPPAEREGFATGRRVCNCEQLPIVRGRQARSREQCPLTGEMPAA